MINFFYYFYYRSLQVYKAPYEVYYKASGPLQLLLGFNLTTILLIFYRLGGFLTGTFLKRDTIMLLGIVGGALAWLICIILVILCLAINKRSVEERIIKYRNESDAQRKKNGRTILFYIVFSVLLYFSSFIL